MRCLYAAAGCLAWLTFVLYAAADSRSDVVRELSHLAIVGVIVLPPTAGVLAICDGEGLGRWKRIIVISIALLVPVALVLLVIAFLSALDTISIM